MSENVTVYEDERGKLVREGDGYVLSVESWEGPHPVPGDYRTSRYAWLCAALERAVQLSSTERKSEHPAPAPDAGQSEQPARPVMHGWYSEQSRAYSSRMQISSEGRSFHEPGAVVYEAPDGREVVVTAVFSDDERPNWPDAIDMGKVTRYLRAARPDEAPLRAPPAPAEALPEVIEAPAFLEAMRATTLREAAAMAKVSALSALARAQPAQGEAVQHFKPCPDPLTLRPDAHLPKPYGDEAPAGPVQRWNLTSRTGFPSMLETKAGPWVRYADIAPYLAPGPREETARLREALEEIMRRAEGCERLIAPSWCGGKNGYLREQWCSGCIARAALAQPGGGA